MHVLFVTSEPYPTPQSPLSGIFQQHQARALGRAGVRVGVISPELRSLRRLAEETGPRRRIVWESDQGVPVVRYQTVYWIPFSERAHIDAWSRATAAASRRYAACNDRPELIHAHNAYPAGIAARSLAARWRIPFVITEHSSAYARQSVPAVAIRLARRAVSAAAARLAVSSSLARLIAHVLGEAANGWQVIPNILDAEFASSVPALRRRQTSPFRFITIGSLLPIKGQDVLLEAFATRFIGHAAELRIVGDGPLHESLRARAIELGVSGQVSLLGELGRQQVRNELETANAYVHPSHYETFGVAIIEALASGLPVIATQCGGPEDMVTERNGRLVPAGDPGRLGEAMADVRSHIETFDPAWIRADCLERFGETPIVQRLISVYEQVLGCAGSAKPRSSQ